VVGVRGYDVYNTHMSYVFKLSSSSLKFMKFKKNLCVLDRKLK
jgi:hypothetical protein